MVTFIAMCVVVCKQHVVKSIVSPAKADMQVGIIRPEAVVVCRDSDNLAHDNRIVIIIDSWPKGGCQLGPGHQLGHSCQ